LVVLAIVALFFSIKIVRQFEKGLVMRLGKYHETLNPGLNFVIPFLDQLIHVDMREKVINVEPQRVITKDNVGVVVDAVVYFKVVDPVKAEFEVEDFDLAATTLAQTNLRNLIGDRTLDETFVARDLINTNLREVLDEATNGWGVKVTRVEVQKIEPPPEIIEAMSLQMKAEREKRAAILQAEGVKQSEILQAEGQRNSDILEAEGQAQATILNADAEAAAIQRVSEAADRYFQDRAEAWRKLQVAETVLDENTKYVIPTNADLINVLGLDGAPNIVPVDKTKKGSNEKDRSTHR
jgi:regulator of protease activity HflC (stomatin/prohibitin superfamily)